MSRLVRILGIKQLGDAATQLIIAISFLISPLSTAFGAASLSAGQVEGLQVEGLKVI
jgi:hypothetical protein